MPLFIPTLNILTIYNNLPKQVTLNDEKEMPEDRPELFHYSVYYDLANDSPFSWMRCSYLNNKYVTIKRQNGSIWEIDIKGYLSKSIIIWAKSYNMFKNGKKGKIDLELANDRLNYSGPGIKPHLHVMV